MTNQIQQALIFDDYCRAIGRLNCYFQTMERVYRDMYYAFVEDYFEDKRKFKTSFREIVKELQTKLKLYYKNDSNTLNTILNFTEQSLVFADKRDFFIHSTFEIHKLNNEPEQFYLYKRTKENVNLGEFKEGKYFPNDDFRLLDIGEIEMIADEINLLNAKIVFYGTSIGMNRNNFKLEL